MRCSRISIITLNLNSVEYLFCFDPFFAIKNMHLQKCLAFGVHIKNGGYLSFGPSPNNTGYAQVRFILAWQPCNCYLLLINGSVGRTSLTGHFPDPFSIDPQYILLLPSCSSHGINVISLTPKFAVSVCELHVSVFLEY